MGTPTTCKSQQLFCVVVYYTAFIQCTWLISSPTACISYYTTQQQQQQACTPMYCIEYNHPSMENTVTPDQQ